LDKAYAIAIAAVLICCSLPANADKLEDWNLRNLPTTDSTQEKKIAASDFTQLSNSIEDQEYGDKQAAAPLDNLWLRDSMLRSFVKQRPIIGLKLDEVCSLLEDCSPPPAGTFRPAHTRIFQIFDGIKASQGGKQLPSMCMEVRFAKNIAYAFRITFKTFKKSESKKSNGTELPLIFEKPNPIDALWGLRSSFELILPPLIARKAEEIGITEASVTRPCTVTFTVSKDGTVTNVVIKESSSNPKFDTLVMDTLKGLSGKPGLRLPSNSWANQVSFQNSIDLLVREPEKH
jgi:TonB family protein